ncbi:response regulator transcription factor [Prolixibacteraceae bacterium JC049]|nr:response regulator transcription factor [Prolixibacteraceae bacterium JC049]
MNKLRVAIVEDEELVAEELKQMLLELRPEIEIAAHLESVSESTKWLSENSVDLLFLDIHLGDGNSFSIFEKIELNTPVVFTTAYDEYAIQAFKLNSIDFLLKPVDTDDLQQALDRVDAMRNAFDVPKEEEEKSRFQLPQSYRKRFLISGGNKMKSISIDEIAYFRAEGKYLYLIDKQGNSSLVDNSLKELENQLNPELFYRINRKMILHYDCINEVIAFSKNRKKVIISPAPSDPLETIVSQERTRDFMQWLNQ